MSLFSSFTLFFSPIFITNITESSTTIFIFYLKISSVCFCESLSAFFRLLAAPHGITYQKITQVMRGSFLCEIICSQSKNINKKQTKTIFYFQMSLEYIPFTCTSHCHKSDSPKTGIPRNNVKMSSFTPMGWDSQNTGTKRHITSKEYCMSCIYSWLLK